jgi:hypothetical protein
LIDFVGIEPTAGLEGDTPEPAFAFTLNKKKELMLLY